MSLLFLYRVAERQARRVDTELEAPFDLARAGHVKARPDVGQPSEHLWRRVGLHREKDPRGRQNVDQPLVARLDQIQVDDEKGRGQTGVVPQKPTDRLGGPGCVQPTVNICCAHTTSALSICSRANPNATQHCGVRGEPLDTQRAGIRMAWSDRGLGHGPCSDDLASRQKYNGRHNSAPDEAVGLGICTGRSATVSRSQSAVWRIEARPRAR